VRRAGLALITSVALIAVGIAGAAAFNPDDGAITHSEPLWRIFGIGAYAGAALFWLTVLALLVMLAVTAVRRARGG